MSQYSRYTQTTEELLRTAGSLMAKAEVAPTEHQYRRLQTEVRNTVQMAAVWAQLADTALQAHGLTDDQAPKTLFGRMGAEFLAEGETDDQASCPPGCVACATDESHDPAPTASRLKGDLVNRNAS